MNCKRIQELIVTDYLDGEATAAVEEQIKAHMGSCAQCRAFEQAVRQNADMVSGSIEPVAPPAEVWQRIQEEIREEQVQPGVPILERFLDLLRENLAMRRPAYALATMCIVILVFVIFWGAPMRRQMLVRDYLSQKTAFMVALNRPANGEMESIADFNTAIEEYLF